MSARWWPGVEYVYWPGAEGRWHAAYTDGLRSVTMAFHSQWSQLVPFADRLTALTGLPHRKVAHAPDTTPADEYARKAIAKVAREARVELAALKEVVAAEFGIADTAMLTAFQAEKTIAVIIPAMADRSKPCPGLRHGVELAYYYDGYWWGYAVQVDGESMTMLWWPHTKRRHAWVEDFCALTGMPHHPDDRPLKGSSSPLKPERD